VSRHFLAIFSREEDLLGAVRTFRADGFEIEDAYTPYAVHGLDEAAGVRRTRLGWVCAVLGLSGAAAMLWFQHWVSAVAWPLNVGGKPLSSIPAFIPVTFEVGVLAAGLGSVFAFFCVSRLYPGKRAFPHLDGVTDDRFAVALAALDQSFDEELAEEISRSHGALEWKLLDPVVPAARRPTVAMRWLR